MSTLKNAPAETGSTTVARDGSPSPVPGAVRAAATAPEMQPDEALPVPDVKSGTDGINDSENTDVDKFVADAFGGQYDPPSPDARSWPAIPPQYCEPTRDYFRRADIEIGEGGESRIPAPAGAPGGDREAAPAAAAPLEEGAYEELLLSVMRRKGIFVKRSAATKAARGVATFLIGATGVGLFYISSKTRQVRPGRVGFYYTLNDNVRFVKQGWSYEPNPMHKQYAEFELAREVINYENHVFIVKVPPGHVWTASSSGSPMVLSAGEHNTVGVHVIVDPNFVLREKLRVDSPHISSGALHIITVRPGAIRALEIDRRPHVLFAGRHVIECASLTTYPDMPDDITLDHSFTVGGRIHFMVVGPGMIGGVRVGEHACFVDLPVRMWFYSEICNVMPPQPVEAEKIEFHNLTRVRVNDYRMGLIEDVDGNLVVLPPGVHVLRKPNLHLVTTSTEWNHVREAMEAITADPLDVKLTLTMAWHVVDPIAHYKAGPPGDSARTIREMALSTMSRVVRNMRFEETLRHYARRDDGREDHKMEQPEEQGEGVVPAQMMQNQFKHLSDKYTNDLLRVYRRDFGIEMDLRVWGFQNFDLKDQNFQKKLTSAVIARADARAARVKLDLTQDTAEIRKQTAKIESEQEKYTQTLAAETNREVRLLQVKTQQEVQDAEVNAEHLRKQKEREIEIEDARAKADAAAYSIEAKAKAELAAARLEIEAARVRAAQEAEAIKLRAEAEREMADANPERFAIEKAGVYADAVRGMNPTITVQSGADVQNALASLFQAVRGAPTSTRG